MATRNITTHGHTSSGVKSKTYTAWKSMNQRCFNPRNRCYQDYGGRGISVCERWRIFSNFLLDMGEVPAGFTIERFDNDGMYEPANCSWATRKDQVRNRRNTVKLEFDGVTKPMAEWAEIFNISHNLLRSRISRGWSVSDSLKTQKMTASQASSNGLKKRWAAENFQAK